jgi:O-antigen ligase
VIGSLLLLAVGSAIVVSAGVDVSSLSSRYTSVTLLLGDPTLDPSYSSRLLQTQLAWQQFVYNPLFGAGPGYSFFIANSLSGDARFTIGLDSPAATLSEFGLMGVVMLAALLISYAALVRRLSNSTEGDPTAQIVLRSVGLMAVLWLFAFGSPINDKGLSFALCCITALALPVSAGSARHIARSREYEEFLRAGRWSIRQLS